MPAPMRSSRLSAKAEKIAFAVTYFNENDYYYELLSTGLIEKDKPDYC
jgi:hypothetical protein